MNNVKEVWKPIKGYENYYSVSNLGNVRFPVMQGISIIKFSITQPACL